MRSQFSNVWSHVEYSVWIEGNFWPYLSTKGFHKSSSNCENLRFLCKILYVFLIMLAHPRFKTSAVIFAYLDLLNFG